MSVLLVVAPAKPGFTLIELLVVIAAHHRADCAASPRQCRRVRLPKTESVRQQPEANRGLALANYESANIGCFIPRARVRQLRHAFEIFSSSTAYSSSCSRSSSSRLCSTPSTRALGHVFAQQTTVTGTGLKCPAVVPQ